MISQQRRRITILIISALALFVTSWLELFLQKKQHVIGGGINRASLFLLINVHVIVIVIFLYVIIRQSIKLFLERHKEQPGSVFKRNLLFAFTFFSVIPSFFVFFTAGKLITKSIDEWFRTHTESGLQQSLLLHEYHTEKERDNISKLGKLLITELASQTNEQTQEDEKILAISQKHTEFKNYTIYLWEQDGAPIKGSIKNEITAWRTYRKYNDRSTNSLREFFFTALYEKITTQKPFDFYGSLYWAHQTPHDKLLILVYRYTEPIRSSLIQIQNALNDYRHLKSMRNSIYFAYFCTFALVTLLILLLSIWCAFYLAKGISSPIQMLIDAMTKMRKGSWDVQVPATPSSDLRSLITGFNDMTDALKQAHTHLTQKNQELFTILENIRASVFLINRWGRIITYNAPAKDLITNYLSANRLRNKKINALGNNITKHFYSLIRRLRSTKKRQLTQEFSLHINYEEKVFMVYLTEINLSLSLLSTEKTLLVVIEELTNIVKLNKIKTWQEAAKQMAHEIKNPLTPIQLATQRLERKYSAQLNDPVFIDCTSTILSQVKIIKDLVTHFSEFASMPNLELESTDIHELIKESTCLYEIGCPEIQFLYNFAEQPIFLKTDKKKLRRVFINLLDNSVRAIKDFANSQNNVKKCISITTKVLSVEKIEILFSDTGPGIPSSVRETLFLPYVSTEKKNMGLGLAIVHDIIKQLGGVITLEQWENGSLFKIVLPSL